mgnify:CR=1 FL=1
MTPYYSDEWITIYNGDCREVLPELSDIETCITDPPYGLAFMGKDWDCAVPGDAFAEQALRVLKPGGHIIAFAATRTVHRLTPALEDAGFEIVGFEAGPLIVPYLAEYITPMRWLQPYLDRHRRRALLRNLGYGSLAVCRKL